MRNKLREAAKKAVKAKLVHWYEMRVWSNSKEEGKLEQAETFTFPVEDSLLEAEQYASNLSVSVWAYITADAAPAETQETAEGLRSILDDDGLALLDDIRSRVQAPAFGILVRRTRHQFPPIEGEKLLKFGTHQDGQFKVIDAVECVDRVIQKLSA